MYSCSSLLPSAESHTSKLERRRAVQELGPFTEVTTARIGSSPSIPILTIDPTPCLNEPSKKSASTKLFGLIVSDAASGILR